MVRPALSICSLLLLGATLLHAQTPVRLDQSICPVDTTAPPTGQLPTHGAYVTRQALRAAETTAPLDFEVALKMRNFAELQGRVAKGERISPQEMAAKYEPSAADSAQVAAWLTAQGFTITRQPDTHLAVFARGTVAQLQSAMQLTFARVSNGSAEFTSAITAPSVPATLAPLLVGINGLQPNVRPHRHFIQRTNSLSGPNAPYLPSQLAQAYNASSLYSSNITGAGQTIAIVIDTFPSTSDLTSFWTTYSVNQTLSNISLINVSGTSSLPATSGEETLDTEWASSIAPGAKVRVYAAGSLAFTALDATYAQVYSDATSASTPGINQLSMSFGLGEQFEGQSQVNTDDQYFVMLTSAGVGLFASSGDAGATPDSTGHSGSGPLQAEAPASDPNVTSVGGTSLTVTSTGSPSSEVVWNDSSGSTGGGTSLFFNRPAWQTGSGVPTGTKRLVPDISAAGDPATGGVVILNGQQTAFGGTSWSSPTWAGFSALINQARSKAGLAPIGELAPLLYPYLGTANLRDITSGNNKFQNTRGFTAGTGYDRCTGVGVPDMENLVIALTPGTAPAISDGPATSTGETGVAYSFTYTASGNPVPTFSLATGSQLPSGITLSTAGVLAGTPTQSGVFTGTVTASNGVGSGATQAYSLTINQPPAVTSAPIDATVAVNYSATFALTATGFPAPVFEVTNGNVPPGLALSSSGVITGTATEAGTFTGVITVSNGIGDAVMQPFSITVDIPTDTPTLPPVALALLGVALMLVAMRPRRVA